MHSLLILDTATDRPQVVISRGHQIESFPLHQAQNLFDCLPPHFDPEGIAVTQGPGSYTGIRLGCAAAKGLAYARNIPMIGISSLEGFISAQFSSFLSVIDARGGGVYAVMQRWEGSEVRVIHQPCRVSLNLLPGLLHLVDGVVGPNLSRLSLLRGEQKSADPERLVFLTQKAWQQGNLGLHPVYDLPVWGG